MIISVNWLKKFVDIDVSIDVLAQRIGERLVEIESVEDLSEKYKDVRIVRVVSCQPVADSDHLNVTKIDDGGVVQGIARDEDGLVQVVCGAPNVRAGLFVAWLPPASIVPETFGTADVFTLGSRTLRGQMSHGMLASAKELALYDDHAGILEIDPAGAAVPIVAGASFADVYELNDHLLDIENKSLTHRPDAFGVIGFAREVAGILGKPFQTPEWLLQTAWQEARVQAELPAHPALPKVFIDDPALSHRFQALVLSGLNQAAESPLWMQTYLSRSGVRPITAAVDISNYLMLLTGQPTHAYDYDKLRRIAGADFTIRVRTALPDEQLTLLDGTRITLDASDIVIAAGDQAIGLAGVMGGASTAVDETTQTIIFEAATFDLYHIRASQMRHGIFSEAVTRFTKGVPAELGTPVIAEAARLLARHTGATVHGAPVDTYVQQEESVLLSLTVERVNKTLGTQFTAEDVAGLLENVDFVVTRTSETAQTGHTSQGRAGHTGADLQVTAPYWRQDIHIIEDVIEEIGRLAGFDTITPTLPARDFSAVRPDGFDTFRATIRSILSRAGANEVLTYSFVHGDLLQKANLTLDNSYRITNSLSPELQYYRQSLTPSLLAQVQPNVKAGYSSFALYELNKVHQKADGLTAEAVPVERDSLGFVRTAPAGDGVAYFEAKHTVAYSMEQLQVAVSYVAINTTDPEPKAAVFEAPFDRIRSARIVHTATGRVIGIVGEYAHAVQKAFKIAGQTAGFELDVRALYEVSRVSGDETHEASPGGLRAYRPLTRFPGTERDVCFQVPGACTYETVLTAAQQSLALLLSAEGHELITSVEPVDIYQPQDSDVKNVTLKFKFASYERTMTNEEVTTLVNTIITSVLQETHGKVV